MSRSSGEIAASKTHNDEIEKMSCDGPLSKDDPTPKIGKLICLCLASPNRDLGNQHRPRSDAEESVPDTSKMISSLVLFARIEESTIIDTLNSDLPFNVVDVGFLIFWFGGKSPTYEEWGKFTTRKMLWLSKHLHVAQHSKRLMQVENINFWTNTCMRMTLASFYSETMVVD